jgi:hypothetical protein
MHSTILGGEAWGMENSLYESMLTNVNVSLAEWAGDRQNSLNFQGTDGVDGWLMGEE